MNKPNSLEEYLDYAIKEQPINVLSFHTGKGTLYEKGFFVQRHWHNEIELLYVKKGSYIIEINLENIELKQGDLCFVNSGTLHQLWGKETETEHEAVIFDPKILDFSYEDEMQEDLCKPWMDRNICFPMVIHPEDALYQETLDLILEIIHLGKKRQKDQEKRNIWYWKTKLKLYELLIFFQENEMFVIADATVSPAEKEKIHRYKNVVSYIENNFDKKITLENLAEVGKCHEHHLCHFFKDVTGESPIQYLIQYRLKQAEDMLCTSTKTVLEISMDCGFENVSYFIRQFKKANGVTPKQYRLQNQK